MVQYYKIYTAKAPVNIAVIKYWGKSDETLKVPINDSLSGTLNIDQMCATTSVAISDSFKQDALFLNGKQQELSNNSLAKNLLDEIRKLSKLDKEIIDYRAHIVSFNNFPTAAGLASSAAGYACLAFVLGHAYGITDTIELSKLARRGSGSACRSLFGGFVHWIKGQDHDSSVAKQVVDHKHWPEMRVIICVISDHQKDVSSSTGMARSVQTSQLIKHRAEQIVPSRISAIKSAILQKDFDTFAELTMQDSNQFHAICLDTYPPLFYLNDTSRQVIKICSIINAHYERNMVAYTFDAGPNACIYLLEDFVPLFTAILRQLLPTSGGDGDQDSTISNLEIKGLEPVNCYNQVELDSILYKLQSHGVHSIPDSISYLISTSIGDGPRLVEEHLEDANLKS